MHRAQQKATDDTEHTNLNAMTFTSPEVSNE